MVRHYLIPRIGSGAQLDPYRPAYCEALRNCLCSPYGLEPVFLVEVDTSDKEHAELAAQIDVVSFPDGDDDAVTFSVRQLKIPTRVGMSKVDTVNELRKLFATMQRFEVYGINPIHGKDLSSPIDDASRNDLARAGVIVVGNERLDAMLLALAAQVALPTKAQADRDRQVAADRAREDYLAQEIRTNARRSLVDAIVKASKDAP